jgi:hypothetical protein
MFIIFLKFTQEFSYDWLTKLKIVSHGIHRISKTDDEADSLNPEYN